MPYEPDQSPSAYRRSAWFSPILAVKRPITSVRDAKRRWSANSCPSVTGAARNWTGAATRKQKLFSYKKPEGTNSPGEQQVAVPRGCFD